MKPKLLFMASALALLSACQQQTTQQVRLVVSNTTDQDAMDVVDGISLKAVLDSLGESADTKLIVTNEMGEQVATQIFNNGTEDILLFKSNTLANGESIYWVQKQEGSAASETEMLIDLSYLAKVDSLRSAGEELSADSLIRTDGYALEGATVALQDSIGRMFYSRVWQRNRVLANGPLLAAFQLDYDTLRVGNDSVLEQRTIIAQAGTPIHIVRVSYQGLNHPANLAVGLAYQGNEDSIRTDNKHCYIAYSSPASTSNPNRNGKNAIGVYIPTLKSTTLEQGHLFGIAQYNPEETFTYYINHGWNRGDSLFLNNLTKELKQLSTPSRTTRIEKD